MTEELCECRQCVRRREESRLRGNAIEVAVVAIDGEELKRFNLHDSPVAPESDDPVQPDDSSYAAFNRPPPMDAQPSSTNANAFREHVVAVTDRLREALLQRESQFTATSPVRIFSKIDPIEKLNLRIDESLSRLMRGDDSAEDAEWNLITDLALKRVALEMAARQAED